MHEIERQQAILRLLEEVQFITVKELADRFSSSVTTIRRDLDTLSLNGSVKRIRGAAQLANANISELKPKMAHFRAPIISEIPFNERMGLRMEQKRLIAKKAVSLCAPDDIIMMDGGSTVFSMVHFMHNTHFVIMTHSLAVATYLTAHTQNTVVLAGGVIYPDSQLLFDPFGSATFKNYSASKVFMGVKGIDERGVSNSDLMLIRLDQEMIERGKQLIILADSSKFGRNGGLILCDFDRVSAVVSDAGVPDSAREMLKAKNVELIIAD
jgi:DeoR family ulaG and ulaABCDEF operon transcriptional repressor